MMRRACRWRKVGPVQTLIPLHCLTQKDMRKQAFPPPNKALESKRQLLRGSQQAPEVASRKPTTRCTHSQGKVAGTGRGRMIDLIAKQRQAARCACSCTAVTAKAEAEHWPGWKQTPREAQRALSLQQHPLPSRVAPAHSSGETLCTGSKCASAYHWQGQMLAGALDSWCQAHLIHLLQRQAQEQGSSLLSTSLRSVA